MSEKIFKYRIDELLNTLSVSEYRIVMRLIPLQLDVSSKTFFNYRNIKLNDKKDIPHEKVVLLEKLFELQPGELQNFDIKARSIAQILANTLKKAK